MGKKGKTEAGVTSAQAEADLTPTPSVPKLIHNKKLSLVGSYTPGSEITWFVTQNPRASGRATFDRFAKYMGSPTVAAYMANGGTKGDLLWDLKSGYLSIAGVTLSGGPLPPRAPREKKVKAPKAPTVTDEGAQVDQSAEASALEAATAEEVI